MDSFGKTFKLFYLGCRVNQYEVQAFRDQFLALGLVEVADNLHDADICIVNTCSVTLSAESSSRNVIRKIIKNNPNAKIFVTGCYVENAGDFINEIADQCTFVPNAKKDRLIDYIFPEYKELPEFAIKTFKGHTRAFLKIQDGCNSFCSYCIVPYLRGRSKSKAFNKIIQEAKDLIHSGFQEIVITGINVGDYKDEGYLLSDVIKAIDALDGIKRIRVSSIDPDDCNDELIDAILNGKHTCHSMHFVLQSGSNTILTKMNRKYNRLDFLNRVSDIRDVDPLFSFSTDIIVGFPGESEEDFNESMNVVQKVQFTGVHIFPYSARPRTKAFLFQDIVNPDVISHRKQLLNKLADEMAFQWRNQFIGTYQDILTENVNNGVVDGHTDKFIKVLINDMHVKNNEIVNVKIENNTHEGLVGTFE